MRLLKSLAIMTLLLVLAGPMLGADEERAKVPDAKELEKAEAVIKDLFKAEFAKLKAADKLDLSNKLHEQGVETKDDPASRYALLKLCCDDDPKRFRSLSLRFSAPVFPGETIRTEIWRDGGRVSFRARAVERDVVVLNNGLLELAA